MLIVLGFLLGSWSMQLHALEHLDAPWEADCEVCQLASGMDDILPPSVKGPAHKEPPTATFSAWAPGFRSHALTAYHSRAPPPLRNY